ncbi:MAG: hypothetical protein FGF51_04515 [Candidatus Brockarchaeota archaeon]|nr:hypothetical protein [Candidatus Brockarchaeota archaeon]
MSKEEIPWDKVAKEIVRILGVESARGLLYGFMGTTVYPVIAEKIRSTMAGGRTVSENDIRRIIQEELARIHVAPQQLTAEDLERKIAELLMRQMPQPQFPQRTPPDVEFEMEQIKNRLNTLENTRNQLLSRKYTTFDEAERRKIEDSIREIDVDIEREKSRLLNIRSMYRV